jgi:hypothetical protein
MCHVIMYSQKGESMDGPVGKFASSVPICWVNRPNRLWPPKALTGMLLGMVQLQHSAAQLTAAKSAYREARPAAAMVT